MNNIGNNNNINNNNYINTELIEKIQNEIKNIETVNTANNATTQAYNLTNINTNTIFNNNTSINTNNTNINTNASSKNPETQIKTITKKEFTNTANNKNIERYIKKKVSPYSAISHQNQSYNTEKSGYTANSTLLNNTATPKESNNNNNNNLNITATQNKLILSKLASAANKKNGPKSAFFNTSMSFDQNNDTKNATFDNELAKKYENNNNIREKSDEKNSASAMNLKTAGGKRIATASEIANAIKNNPIISSATGANKNTNNNNNNTNNNNINENYLIKKAANKKFDTIREEDEDMKTHKKPFSYLNYYTKFAPEAKNHRVNQNLISAYNADSNYPTNSLTTNNNLNNLTNNNLNNLNMNNTYNPNAGNTSILKKITKRFNNESSFLEQYVTNNKKMLSSSYASSPNKKTSVSPVFKSGANSSRAAHNANTNITANNNNYRNVNKTNFNNSSVGKDNYNNATESAFSTSLNKNRSITGGNISSTLSKNNNTYNNNNISTNTTSNLNNIGKSALYNNNNSVIVNTYTSNSNKTDMLDFHRKIRQKNISVPNASKFITAGVISTPANNKQEKQDASSKLKKINNANLTNLNKFLNTNTNNNNNQVTNSALSYYKNKSPLNKPPVSTSMAPVGRQSVTAGAKAKNPNLNMTGHSVILNNSARKDYNNKTAKGRGSVAAKAAAAAEKLRFNLNLTTNNFNNTLVTEDNSVTNPNGDVLHTRSSVVNSSFTGKKAVGNPGVVNNHQNFVNSIASVNNNNNVNNINNNLKSLGQGSASSSKQKFNLEGKFFLFI